MSLIIFLQETLVDYGAFAAIGAGLAAIGAGIGIGQIGGSAMEAMARPVSYTHLTLPTTTPV